MTQMTRLKPSRSERMLSVAHSLDIGCRYLFLNVLWVAGCVPIVTAPAATAALHAVTAEWARGDERPVFERFRAELRANFRWSAIASFSWLPVGVLVGFNLLVSTRMGAERQVVMTALLAILVPYLLFMVNLIPANLGEHRSLKAASLACLLQLVRRPGASVLIALLVLFAAALVYFVPILVLVVPAPTARLIGAVHSRTRAPQPTIPESPIHSENKEVLHDHN